MGEKRALFFIIVIAVVAIVFVIVFHVVPRGLGLANTIFILVQIVAIVMAVLLRRKLTKFQGKQDSYFN